MPETTEKTIFSAFKAVLMLLGNEKLQNDLKDEERSQESLREMGMPESVRGELLNLLTRVERLQARAVDQFRQINTDRSPEPSAVVQDERYERMQLEVFDHIRTSFRVALGMSVTLFLIGLILMVIAVLEAVHETAVSTSTLTIAGLGLADFVLLFFRRPWQDISVNLSNSQQVRTIATSYLVGLSLLPRKDPNAFKLLSELTERSVVMLQQYTEERTPDHEAAPEEPEKPKTLIPDSR